MDFDMDINAEDLLAELQEVLDQGGQAYVLSGEELEQFMDMDQRATHVIPATMH